MSSSESSRNEILRQLSEEGRKNSTGVVLFHSAIADQLGLNLTDYKCIDVIAQRQPITAGQLAEITGLSTGTVTAVLDRIEKAGFIQRVAAPEDRRKVLLKATVTQSSPEAQVLFKDFMEANAAIMSRYSDDQLRTILDYVTATTQLYNEQALNIRQKAAKPGKKT